MCTHTHTHTLLKSALREKGKEREKDKDRQRQRERKRQERETETRDIQRERERGQREDTQVIGLGPTYKGNGNENPTKKPQHFSITQHKETLKKLETLYTPNHFHYQRRHHRYPN